MKKIYADKSVRNRRRQWKLKHLDVEDAGSVNSTIERFVRFFIFLDLYFICSSRDYTEFLEDLEEDAVLRQNVNVYKGKKNLNFNFLEKNFDFLLDDKKLQQTDDEGEDDFPRIDLNEMLADMTMEDSDKMDS